MAAMARGRGQIPPYGKHFRLLHGDYHPVYTHSIYQYKANGRYAIRAEKGSKRWWVLFTGQQGTGAIHDQPFPSLTKAMEFLTATPAAGQAGAQSWR
jgi:hypothetical protein